MPQPPAGSEKAAAPLAAPALPRQPPLSPAQAAKSLTPSPANAVTPKLPSLATPQATNDAMEAWMRHNYARKGMFNETPYGYTRPKFYEQITTHLQQPPAASASTPAPTPAPAAAPTPTDSVGRYTQILNDRFNTLMPRTPVPYKIDDDPKGQLHTSYAMDEYNNPTRTVYLPNNPDSQYIGHNAWARYAEKDPSTPRDAFTWGRAQPRSLVGLHEREHVQQGRPTQQQLEAIGGSNSPQLFRNDSSAMFGEPAAVTGEMVNAVDAAHQATNTPVAGNIALAPGYAPSLEWMRQQAKQHGYDGVGGTKNMTQLQNTPAGQAWLRMQMQRFSDAGNPGDYKPPATTTPNMEPTSAAALQNMAAKFRGVPAGEGFMVDGQFIPAKGPIDPNLRQKGMAYARFARHYGREGLGPGQDGWSSHPYDFGAVQPETSSKDNFLQSMLKGTYDNSKQYRWNHGIVGEAVPGDQDDASFYYNDQLRYVPRVKQNSATLRTFGASMKQAELAPEVQLQEHQQRIADRVSGEDPRMLVYHGLGSGKSLSAIAAAEAAKKIYGGDYGIVVPASLKGNFQKEIGKFTRNSDPEILSYTGLGSGKQFKNVPDTLIMDEAARLRNPNAAMTRAALQNAARAKRVMLLTGTPITNEPKDLASLISIVRNEQYDPAQFDKDFVGEKRVWPSFWGFLHGAGPGVKPIMKNGPKLRSLLEGHVDYQPSKTPEGVNVNEETVNVPLSKEQQRIQKAIRTKIPPGFLWKLDKEFPLSREELAKLNSFMTGLRQVSLSTQPFRADKSPLKAFGQSAKLQEAFKRLRENLDADPRRKAIIYSNFVDAGLGPYAAGLEANKVPYGIFHGGIPTQKRLQALKDYNEGRLRALLIGPAGAEGISTKGTSLIQLLDPYWNESRLQQARGRGLRFDSHAGLPEDLKNVAVQRYLSTSDEPGVIGKLMGHRRQRTGDEVIQRMSSEKEQLNEQFRQLLREVGTRKPAEKPAEKSAEKPAEKQAELRTVIANLAKTSVPAA